MKGNFRSLGWGLVKLGVELFISTYGATLVAAESMYLFYPLVRPFAMDPSFHQFNHVLSVPYFPIQIACGLTIGYLGRRRFGTRFSFCLWVVPLFNLTWHFLAFEPGVFADRWLSRLDHFVGSACRRPCSDQLVYTAPLYASIAYGLGAFAKKRLEATNKDRADEGESGRQAK